jgi:hypothetical protein
MERGRGSVLSRPMRLQLSTRPAAADGRSAASPASFRLAVAAAGLAFLLRARTAGHFRTWDETTWLLRSERFGTAVGTGQFDHASSTPDWTVATMPGVTTMVIGAAAHAVWRAGQWAGLWAQAPGDTFELSRTGLLFAHLGVAAVTAALVGLLVLLLARWVGTAAAGIAGVLVGTEPWLVAHGAVLHTDELMTLFAITSLVAAALALGLPHRTDWAGRQRVGLLAGLLFGAALLTKISAVLFLPGAVLLAGWAVVRARSELGRVPAERDGGVRVAARTVRAPVAGWLAGAGGLSLVAYPALWLMVPVTELGRLTMSLGLGVYPTEVRQLFLGHPVTDPGPAFYLVVLPFRMTPWLLVGTLAGAVAICCRRVWRGYALALGFLAGPPFLLLSLANKKFDRYALPFLVLGAILVGIVLAPVVPALLRRYWPARPARTAAAVAAVAALLVGGHSLLVAPWGSAYFDPLLGGGPAALRTIPVGWGEGLEQAGRFIARREAGRCDSVSVYSTWPIRAVFPCGVWLTEPQAPAATYLVLYIGDRQVLPPARTAELIGPRALLTTITLRGLDYARVYGPAQPGSGGAGGG